VNEPGNVPPNVVVKVLSRCLSNQTGVLPALDQSSVAAGVPQNWVHRIEDMSVVLSAWRARLAPLPPSERIQRLRYRRAAIPNTDAVQHAVAGGRSSTSRGRRAAG
jgi:hypothetical protein